MHVSESKPVRIIAVTSGKGGVGKTAVAANLGVCLALAGFKTLIVDADVSMSNLGLHFQMEYADPDLKKALSNPELTPDAIRRYDLVPDLFILPSNIRFEKPRLRADSLQRVLSRAVEIIQPNFVIIDTPAGFDVGTILSVMCADEVLFVVVRDLQSLVDAKKIHECAVALKKKLTGIVVNMADKGDREIVPELIEKALTTVILSSIPYDENFASCAAEGVPFVLKYPKSATSKEFFRCVCKLTGVSVDATIPTKKIRFLDLLRKKFRR